MRGSSIINKYILDSMEYLFSELSKEQFDYVESNAWEMKPTNDEYGYESLAEQLNEMDIRRDKITNETQEIQGILKMF